MIVRFSPLRATLSFAIVSLSIGASQAQERDQSLDTLVVTASRTQIPIRQSGSSMTVLTAEDIERRQLPLLADLLRDIPGLAVSRSGPVGALTQVRIRGAEANHTLVLIDGIEANDPVSGSEFNFAHLLSSDIERIEVLRGPQSALYGSEAIGGVINIITREGRGDWSSALHVEGGSFATSLIGAAAQGAGERYHLAMGINRLQTDGENMARGGNEQDGYENLTFNTKAGVEIGDKLHLDAVVRYSDAKADSDIQDFAFPPSATQGLVIDSDDVGDFEQMYGSLRGRWGTGERWQHRLGVAWTADEKAFRASGIETSSNKGERFKLDYQVDVELSEAHGLTLAFEREELDYLNRGPTATSFENQKQQDRQNSWIAEYRGGFGARTFVSASLRFDANDLFDDAETYRLTGAYLFASEVTRVHASWGRGITNPGFFELFGFFPSSFLGNPDLRPEQADGFDLGVEHDFGRTRVDLSYFQTDLSDEIQTVFDFDTFMSSAVNLDQDSERSGFELSVETRISERFGFNFAYTYTDSEQGDGQAELRRPEHIAALDGAFAFLDGRLRFNLGIDYNGKQQDAEFVFATPESRATLDSFVLVNASASYRVNSRIELFGRVENLLDESYEEVFSFAEPGLGAYAGIKLKFE